MVTLDANQQSAVSALKASGSILVGATGSGKSIVGLYWYLRKSEINPPPLYIITTPKKRDGKEWEDELIKCGITPEAVKIDSWNNIKKYADVKESVFIFDEDRVIGNGSWAKTFIKIARSNEWVILTATPGDTWFDYVAVFIANGFYKNRTEFEREHVIWNPYTRYPSVLEWKNVPLLVNYRNQIIVDLKYDKHTIAMKQDVILPYDTSLYESIERQRWNKWTDEPIHNVTEYCYCLRRACNENPSKTAILSELIRKHPKMLIFYNFNYELEELRNWAEFIRVQYTEYNGMRHMAIPTTSSWVYFVQYNAGNEAWNCIETDTIVFFSSNYSYRCMTQSAGRIDRRNTPFTVLYYYYLKTNSKIDKAIDAALSKKEDFNARKFVTF